MPADREGGDGRKAGDRYGQAESAEITVQKE